MANIAQGIREFQKSLIINQTDPALHNNLGAIYLNAGNLEKSQRSFKKALIMNPITANATGIYTVFSKVPETVFSLLKKASLLRTKTDREAISLAYYRSLWSKSDEFFKISKGYGITLILGRLNGLKALSHNQIII